MNEASGLKFSDLLLELMTTVFVAVEEVKARTTGRKKHCIARTCDRRTFCHSFLDGMGIIYLRYFLAEEIEQLGIVLAHADNGLDLFLDKRKNLAVIVALVFFLQE